MEVLPIFAKSPKVSAEDGVQEVFVRKPRRYFKPSLLFILVVVLPVIAAIGYFGFLASDVYISESQFVVRTPQKPTLSPLGAILQSAGFTNASDEASAAQSFAVSRDGLKALNANGAVERAYTRPGISIVDRFDPFGIHGSFEYLYRYFQQKVGLDEDNSTGIITLTVRAFTPQDAYQFNQRLLELTEARVNRLNERGREDLVDYAQSEVNTAKARSEAAAIALADYRSHTGVVDPQAQAQVEMGMISSLQTQLIAAKTELAQVQHYAPQNPQIPVIRSEIGTIEKQIGEEEEKVTGGRRSLSGNAIRFQRLTLESDFADKQLAAALASFEQAKDDERRKQAYLERIVQPNVPDSPMEPDRLRGIFATLVVGLIAYGILRMLLAGVKEHAQ